MPVGEIVGLWRYPVKSMQGEEVNGTIVTERGLLGDRAYAILDRDTGYIASAKHPKKWAKLFACRAVYAEPPQRDKPLPFVWITLPDGQVISSAQPHVDALLSQALGRRVTLVSEAPAASKREADRTPLDSQLSEEVIRQEEIALAAPAGTFFDYAPLHLLTTATINQLRKLYPAGRFEMRRFRPNIVVASLEAEGFAENQWIGKQLQVGEEIRFQVVDPCPRCVVTTLAQSDLPRDTGILRTIAQHNSAASAGLAPGHIFPAVAGVYGSVLQSGTIQREAVARLLA